MPISRRRLYINLLRHRIVRPKLWALHSIARSMLRRSSVFQNASFSFSLDAALPLLSGETNERIRYPLHTFIGLSVKQNTLRGIIDQAECGLRKEFTVLSNTPHHFGESFAWHTDFNTHYTWSNAPSHAEEHFRYPHGTDIKTVWEIGRCHHLLWLALGYEATNTQLYAKQVISDIFDCMKQNSVGKGVQWTMPMEIAIRAINIVFGLIGIAPSFSDHDILREQYRHILSWLHEHGHYLHSHQEYTRRPNNHLLSNGLGLFILGCFFELILHQHSETSEYRAALSWKKEGAKILEQAMQDQVYSDGGNYEKSSAYHALVLEMFALGFAIAKHVGWKFSSLYEQRLYRMYHVFDAFLESNGTIPLIGDADNGRILRISADEKPHCYATLHHMLERILFHDTPVIAPTVMPLEHFSEMGYIIHHTSAHSFFLDVGDYGMNGWGGHGHNDCLAFVWSIHGETIITDSGCGSYTGNKNLREYQRSTKAHNTVSVHGAEQCEFLNLWRIKSDTTDPLIRSLHANETTLNCSIQHHGYVERFGVIHRRTLVLSHVDDTQSGELLISDELETIQQPKRSTASAMQQPSHGYLHIPPEINIEPIDAYSIGYTGTRSRGIIWCSSPLTIEVAPYSTYYGDVDSHCTKLTYLAPAFVRITWETYHKPHAIFSGYLANTSMSSATATPFDISG